MRLITWYAQSTARVQVAVALAGIVATGHMWALWTGRPAPPVIMAFGLLAAMIAAIHWANAIIDRGCWRTIDDAGVLIRELGVLISTWARVREEAAYAARSVIKDAQVWRRATKRTRGE